MKEDVFGSIRLFLALTLLLGLAYPATVWVIGRAAFRDKADGSFLGRLDGSGAIVGSALIGQAFSSKKLFHGRPSAAGDRGYDPTQSGGTNLGPTSKKLADSIRDAVAAVRKDEGSSGPVPADAVTSSASGVDPDISPEYARLQIPRIARETRIPTAELEALVAGHVEGRFLGLYGERRVNVLALNREIDARLGHPQIAPTPMPTLPPVSAPASPTSSTP